MTNGQPKWDDATSVAELQQAFENGERDVAGQLLDSLCHDLDGTGRRIDAQVAKKVLALLRNYVWFEKLNTMAEKFQEHAQDDAQVLRQLAQARIELKQITKAIKGLQALKTRLEKELEKPDLDPTEKETLEEELGETLGLLGRAYKQLYVNAGPSKTEPRKYDFDEAIRYYGFAYENRLGDYLWHGINQTALLAHRERVVGDRKYSPEAEKIAESILATIDNKELRGPLYPWDLANRIEANLAKGDTPAAIQATEAYLESADAFNVQSTRRQLIEVWQLDESRAPGNQILPMMNARFAELGGAPVAVELDPATASLYEKVWDETSYRPLQWLHKALERSKCVARIGANKYEGSGTGFLFDGSWINDHWEGKPLLLTNAHVCSDDPDVQAQFPYPSGHKSLSAAFLGSGGASEAMEIKFTKLLWSSSPSQLDATLLMLESVPDGSSPPPLNEQVPPVKDPTKVTKDEARLNILGHPKGLDLRISLQDNKTVAFDDTFVHYKTPTDPGSSGSPVFDQNWQLVALHHASSSAKKANEGIRIDVLIEAIKKALPANPDA